MFSKSKRTVFATALLTSIGLSSAAIGQTFECSLSGSNTKGWVPEWIVFSVDEANKTVTVLDPITYYSLETTAQAKLRVNSDRRWEFKWDTGNLKSVTNDETRFTYSAVYVKKANRLQLYAKPRGFHNDFTGRGPCKPSNRKLN